MADVRCALPVARCVLLVVGCCELWCVVFVVCVFSLLFALCVVC